MCGHGCGPRRPHPRHAQRHPHPGRARRPRRRRPPHRPRLQPARAPRPHRGGQPDRPRPVSADPPHALHVGHHRPAQGRHHRPVGRGHGAGRSSRTRPASGTSTPNDLHMVCSPMYHTVSIRFASCTLLAGGSLAILSRFDAATALDTLRRHRPTTAFLVPTHLHRILQDPALGTDERFDSLRLLAHAGAPCPDTVKRAIMERVRPGGVWEFYGSTEAQFSVCPPEDWLERPGTVGRARPGRRLHIVPVPTTPPHAGPEADDPGDPAARRAPSGATCPSSPASATGRTPRPPPPPGTGRRAPSATSAASMPTASST